MYLRRLKIYIELVLKIRTTSPGLVLDHIKCSNFELRYSSGEIANVALKLKSFHEAIECEANHQALIYWNSLEFNDWTTH